MKEKFILSLSFGNYLKADGGVDKAIKEYQELFNENGISYVHVSPVHPSGRLGKILDCCHNYLYTLLLDGEYYGLLDEKEMNRALLKISSTSSICAIHIHHTKKFRKDFFKDFLDAFKAPIYFFLHDYYSICSQVNLLYNGKYFCGEGAKNSDTCRNCTYSSTLYEHKNIIEQIMNSGMPVYIVAPSEIVIRIWKNTYGNYLNSQNYYVVPHQIGEGHYSCFPAMTNKIKIAYVGRFDKNKGKESWIKLCDAIRKNNLPYSLYYFGFSDIDIPNIEKVNVRVTPDNPNMMLDELRKRGINAVFLWSICPETYSYAYFESLAGNCFVLTNKDSGNISYMTKKNANGMVFENDDDLIRCIEDVDVFSKIINDYSNSQKYGPFSYSQNKQILTLLGKEIDNYSVGVMGKKNRVPWMIKKVMNYLYKKKNNNCF